MARININYILLSAGVCKDQFGTGLPITVFSFYKYVTFSIGLK